MTPRRRAVFLDKDGTLIENVPYSVDPGTLRLCAGAVPALTRLQAAGFALVIVSNQSGVARGLFSQQELRALCRRLREQLALAGVDLLDIITCPHHPDGVVAELARRCGCRKPAPGMLLGAARRHAISTSDSWMIGDILDDVEAGHRAGCRSILVDSGGETEWRPGPLRSPEATVASLAEACDLVLSEHASSPRRCGGAEL